MTPNKSVEEREIRASGLFDEQWYLQQYPDVAAAGGDPLQHYLAWGGLEGRCPNPLFDAKYYLRHYANDLKSSETPLGHFLRIGAYEGKNPSAYFHSTWYLQNAPHLIATYDNPLVHYSERGWKEGLEPHPLFSGALYLEQNVDVAEAGVNPLSHYLIFGRREGRALPTRDIETPLVAQFHFPTDSFPFNTADKQNLNHLTAFFRAVRLFRNDELYPIAEIALEHSHLLARTLFGFNRIVNRGRWVSGPTCAVGFWINGDLGAEIGIAIDADPYFQSILGMSSYVTMSSGHCGLVSISKTTSGRTIFPLNKIENNKRFIGDQSDSAINNCSLSDDLPEVSIIVSTEDNAMAAILTITSILDCSVRIPYELIVVANGCSWKERELLHHNSQTARFIDLPFAHDLGECNNLAAEAARAPHLLFVEPGNLISTGLIEELLEGLSLVQGCGAIGAVHCQPSGSIQQSGYHIDENGTFRRAEHLSNFWNDSIPEERFVRVDFVRAACLLVKSEIFKTIGGFDYLYEDTTYRDAQFCTKLKLANLSAHLATHTILIQVSELLPTASRESRLQVREASRKTFEQYWNTHLKKRSASDAIGSPAIHLCPREYSEPTQAAASPYALVPGGGERYILSTARALSTIGPTALVSPSRYSQARINRLSEDLAISRFKLTSLSQIDAPRHHFERYFLMANEFFPSHRALGQSSLFHCQFPFPLTENQLSNIDRKLDRLSSYRQIVVNSNFTRDALARELARFGREATLSVVYPPIATKELVERRDVKQPWIISVGRFSRRGHAKRQDVILKAFLAASKRIRQSWKLKLCGIIPSDMDCFDYFAELKEMARNEPNVEFVVAPTKSQLQSLLAQSAIYVHAAGIGVTTTDEFFKCEHFGIAVAEALAAGCQTFAYEIGGPAEIFQLIGSGGTYRDMDELINIFNQAEITQSSTTTRQNVRDIFSDDVFEKTILRLFD